ncbi:zinc knuckle CX2CX4HX4C containing protein [Tanacetum coccineum]
MGFKPQKEYRPVPKKTTASSSGNKKKGVEPTIEVSNPNPFDVLNSVDNDVEFGTNRGTTNLVNNEATSSGKLRLSDNEGNPLVLTGIMESDSEVEVVFDDTANLRISMSGKDGSDKGYGTNSLLEQWRDSYPDNDDYDRYDDDMYENHDLSEHLQSICDDLVITADREKERNERLDDLKGIVEDVYEDESIAARSLVADERDLQIAKSSTNGCPWILMGDFNVTLKLEEHSTRKLVISSDMQDFIDCVNQIEVEDVFRTWMTFGGNTHDLGLFGEETDKTTDLHQNLLKNDANRPWRRVASKKRRHRDLSSDGVKDLTTASRRNRLKSDLEDPTW